jgi:hypothetical protein
LPEAGHRPCQFNALKSRKGHRYDESPHVY